MSDSNKNAASAVSPRNSNNSFNFRFASFNTMLNNFLVAEKTANLFSNKSNLNFSLFILCWDQEIHVAKIATRTVMSFQKSIAWKKLKILQVIIFSYAAGLGPRGTSGP